MALTYGFFDAELVQGQYDRVYDAAEFAQYFSLLIKNGVFPDPSTNLQVKASSPTANMNVNIEAGYGWINGYWAKNDSPYTLTIQPAHGSLNRIDAVVLRWVSSTRSMEFDVLTGTPNASPQVPNLTRTVEIYELMLASITVANGATSIAQASITDKRPDSSVCGWVTSLIENIDTTDLFAQFEDAFETWFDNIKGQLEGDVVTNLQRQIDERVKIEDKATEKEAIAGTNDTKWMTPKTTDVAVTAKVNKIGDIVTAAYNKEIDSNGSFVKCDGRSLLDSEYPKFGNMTDKIFGNPIAIYAQTGSISEYTNLAEGSIITSGYSSKYIYKVHYKNSTVFFIRILIDKTIEGPLPGSGGLQVFSINIGRDTATFSSTPIFTNDDESFCCFTVVGYDAVYTIRFNNSTGDISIIDTINIQSIGLVTGTIKTNTGYRTLALSSLSNTKYGTVLDVNIFTGTVAKLVTYNGSTITYGQDTCYCLYKGVLYIQAVKSSNNPCTYTVDPSTYNSISVHDYDDDSIPAPVKKFLFQNDTKGYTHLLSYSDTVCYGAYINNAMLYTMYKIDTTKEEEDAFTIIEVIDITTLKPINIQTLGIDSIDLIQIDDTHAWGVMLELERTAPKQYYFEIKGNTMYVYDLGLNQYYTSAYGRIASKYEIKNATSRTDVSYSHVISSEYYYGYLKVRDDNGFVVPNLRTIDYIKVK